MVAPSVPRLGFEPQVCLARPILVHALDCYERGDYIGAGVRLREAVRRFVVAACRWYAIDLAKAMKRDKYGRTCTLVKALREAKCLDKWGAEIVMECVEVGNLAAHCRPFCKQSLKGGISLMFLFIDSEPYSALQERQPVIVSSDANDCCDDDDDSADWWKQGGVQ